jgi:hypothetical protein
MNPHLTSSLIPSFALAFVIFLQPSSFLRAQGLLTPPGAPAPTMKTLDQMEPRTPISTYGTNITAGGSYYLTANLTGASTTQDAITISADNVTIDLNGFALLNTAGTGTSADGISFTSRKNVTIRNGTIQGFSRGIFGNGISPGILLEYLKIGGCFLRGISLLPNTDVPGGVVRHNVIYTIGGSTVGAADQEVRGIELSGGSFVVEANTVVGITGKGASEGYGIFCTLNQDTFVINNRISRTDNGIRMNGPNEYRDNFTSNCTNPYVAGTDRGNNN